MRSPKLSKDKKMAIAKECIENVRNYKETCVKYGIKYSNLYSWVSKYQDKIAKSSDYSEEDIVCVIRVKKKRFKKSSDEYFRDNVLNRDFSTTKDNQK